MRRITLLAVAAVLVATACEGGGGIIDPDPGEELTEAITAQALANPDRSFDDAAAACVAQGIVAEFGVDGLAELGVTPDNPDLRGGRVFATPDNGRRVVDVGMECISVSEAIVSFLPAGVNLLEESVQCLADGLETPAFRDLFGTIVATGAPPWDILENAVSQVPIGVLFFSCLSGEEISSVGDLLG